MSKYQDVIIGPFEGRDPGNSVLLIMTRIIGKVPFGLKNSIEARKSDETLGTVRICIKDNAEVMAVGVLLLKLEELAQENGVPIRRIDRGRGDNPGSGNIPKTPIIPPRSPNTLVDHARLPASEQELRLVEFGPGSADWWRHKGDQDKGRVDRTGGRRA